MRLRKSNTRPLEAEFDLARQRVNSVVVVRKDFRKVSSSHSQTLDWVDDLISCSSRRSVLVPTQA